MADELPSDEAILAEMVARDLAILRRAHEHAMAAEKAEFPEAQRGYHKAARSLRQTMALKARLARMAAEDARATRPPPAPQPSAIIRSPVPARAEALRAAVRRVALRY